MVIRFDDLIILLEAAHEMSRIANPDSYSPLEFREAHDRVFRQLNGEEVRVGLTNSKV
jgi:hypothetical protein